MIIKTSVKIAAVELLEAALVLIVAASTFATSVIEVNALPPAKAQTILAAELTERGAVASGGTGRGGGHCRACG